MANNKTGLSYYNVDTDRYQDMRIKRLKRIWDAVGLLFMTTYCARYTE